MTQMIALDQIAAPLRRVAFMIVPPEVSRCRLLAIVIFRTAFVHPGKRAAILIDEEASDPRPNWVGVLSTHSRRAYRLKAASAGARDGPKAAAAPLRE